MNPTINSLDVPISNDPINGLKRKLVHDKLMIGKDLEMKHFRKIVYYEKIADGTPEGAYGRPILDVIAASNLSDEAKTRQLEIYQPVDANADTTGSYVDSTGKPIAQVSFFTDANGAVVPEGTPGAIKQMKWPDGSVPELQFWQNMPIAFIQPAPTLVSQTIYQLMQMSMKAADNNGRV